MHDHCDVACFRARQEQPYCILPKINPHAIIFIRARKSLLHHALTRSSCTCLVSSCPIPVPVRLSISVRFLVVAWTKLFCPVHPLVYLSRCVRATSSAGAVGSSLVWDCWVYDTAWVDHVLGLASFPRCPMHVRLGKAGTT